MEYVKLGNTGVAEIAEQRGVPRVQIALAWLLQKESVTSPIIGVTPTAQLEEAVAVDALAITLTQEEITLLEELYVPHKVVGAQ